MRYAIAVGITLVVVGGRVVPGMVMAWRDRRTEARIWRLIQVKIAARDAERAEVIRASGPVAPL